MNAFARAQPASAPPRPLERLRSLLPAETAPCVHSWAALAGRQHRSRGITGSAAAAPSAPCPVGTRGPQSAATNGAGGSASRPLEHTLALPDPSRNGLGWTQAAFGAVPRTAAALASHFMPAPIAAFISWIIMLEARLAAPLPKPGATVRGVWYGVWDQQQRNASLPTASTGDLGTRRKHERGFGPAACPRLQAATQGCQHPAPAWCTRATCCPTMKKQIPNNQ